MSELIDALNQLQKEKHIEKEVIMQAIEDSLVAACNRDFGKNAIVKVNMDRDTGDISVYVEKTVVEEVEDPATEISLADAKMIRFHYEIGDVVNIEVTPKNFGRIAAQHARSVIVQKIKEEERRVVFEHFAHKEKDIVTGVVQRYNGKNISVSLDDKTDAVLTEKEQVKGEVFKPTDRIKLYIVEVKDTNKGPKILVSRTHPELVKRLFEKEVAEVYDGTVEIKSIAREAGSRTKIAVASNDPNVDPVGACVGINGARVNAIVSDLRGEKIDIIEWNDDPAVLIENALSPSNVVSVDVDEEEKSARVVVPDYQLSLAIGKEGQNARLAAKLTGYKIDIKSESQAAELAEELDFGDDFGDLDEAEDFDLEAPVEEPEVSASEATADLEAEEVTEEPETAEDSFEEVSSVYSPKSVVSCMRLGKLGNYWNQTETFEALQIYIDMNFEGLRDDILSMLAGEEVPVNTGSFTNDMTTFRTEDDVLTLLIHLGYLGYHYSARSVFIPNDEIRAEYVNAVSVSDWGEVSKALKNSADTLQAIWQGREKQVAEGIRQAHFETSHTQYNDENALSYTISLALYAARNFYTVHRELSGGKGFADLVFIPRKRFADKPALVVELKWNKDAVGAIAQIKEREYCQSLEEYHGNLLLVGVNYDKKTQEHSCKIEEYRK